MGLPFRVQLSVIAGRKPVRGCKGLVTNILKIQPELKWNGKIKEMLFFKIGQSPDLNQLKIT